MTDPDGYESPDGYELVLDPPYPDVTPPAPDRNAQWEELFSALDSLGLTGSDLFWRCCALRAGEGLRDLWLHDDGRVEWL